MKVCFALAFYLSAGALLAQENLKKGSHWGFKAGATYNQLSGDNRWFFFKKGFEGGMFVKVKLAKKLSGQVEALFVQKGVAERRRFARGVGVNLWYFETPLLLQMPYKKFLFEAGPAFGFLLMQEQNRDDYFISKGWGYQSFKFHESSFNIGLQYFLGPQCALNLRYSNSIVPIRKKVEMYDPFFNNDQFNNVLALTFTARFKTKAERTSVKKQKEQTEEN